MSGKWGNDIWPCSYPGNPEDGPRFCKHPECKRRGPAVPPPPPAPPAGVSPDQWIRAQALAAATSGGPRDPGNAINDARRYANWIKEGS